MITDAYHLQALFVHFRGRMPSPAEVDAYVNKVSYKDLIPALDSGDEHQRWQLDGEIGRQVGSMDVLNDLRNWKAAATDPNNVLVPKSTYDAMAEQITTLQEQLKKTPETPTEQPAAVAAEKPAPVTEKPHEEVQASTPSPVVDALSAKPPESPEFDELINDNKKAWEQLGEKAGTGNIKIFAGVASVFGRILSDGRAIREFLAWRRSGK